MARKNKNNHLSVTNSTTLHRTEENSGATSSASGQSTFWSRLGGGERLAVIAVVLLLALGATGTGLKYLEDSAKRERAANAGKSKFDKADPSFLSKVNPFVEPPPPDPTPQLSKEYIYAPGSRMLAVEDANANAAPPADLAVWRPSTGYWYVLGGIGSQQTAFQWGGNGDQTVPGDFDGDGKTDFSVFRPSNGTWYIQRSSDSGTSTYLFGQSGDVPAAADYDGDGKTDAAVFRSGTWYVQKSSDASLMTQTFGLTSDTPTPADFDGDGKADIAVWRNSEAKFYILRSSSNFFNYQTIVFGQTGDKPVVGDYDGDGRADAAVWKAGTQYQYQWHALYSSDQTMHATSLGDPLSDVAVQNDYDGDGKCDMAIWRPSNGTWYIQKSTGGTRQEQWGGTINGVPDVPVPAYYRR